MQLENVPHDDEKRLFDEIVRKTYANEIVWDLESGSSSPDKYKLTFFDKIHVAYYPSKDILQINYRIRNNWTLVEIESDIRSEFKRNVKNAIMFQRYESPMRNLISDVFNSWHEESEEKKRKAAEAEIARIAKEEAAQKAAEEKARKEDEEADKLLKAIEQADSSGIKVNVNFQKSEI